VSRGHERDLYGAQQSSPILNRVVNENNVIGIDGPDGAAILKAVRSLLENGVRRICVSLQGTLQNPEQEHHIKRIIDEQYPDHFLGSVPVLTGIDICQNTDDMTRTCYAVINAYTHSALAATLFKAEDELRYSQGYSRAFLISHINGGVAGVSKTRAIDTMESGPVLGLYGTRYLAKIYGLKNVIALGRRHDRESRSYSERRACVFAGKRSVWHSAARQPAVLKINRSRRRQRGEAHRRRRATWPREYGFISRAGLLRVGRRQPNSDGRFPYGWTD